VPEEVSSVREWRDLSRRYTALSCELENALKDGHGLGMSEFEVLDRLAEADHESLRMQELGSSVHLSQSALSRTVARLEKEGLVERCLCAEDRRGVFVRLNDAGRERHAQARPTQRAVISATLPPAAPQ